MRKIYFNFIPCICLVLACLYRYLEEKTENIVAHILNMNLKIVMYHKASTYLNMSKACSDMFHLKNPLFLVKCRNTSNLL